jgi:hypothetical protein
MSRTYDENMPIAELMRKINSGEIKKFKPVRPRYYDENMPIAELMRKINSGEIEKVRPYKPVRPRRKLIVVDDKRYRFQEDIWKTILEFLLTARSKRIVLLKVRLSTASVSQLANIMRRCQIRKKERTNVLRIQSIVEHLKNPSDTSCVVWRVFLDISYSEFRIRCVGDMRLYFPHIRELWQKSHFDCIMKDVDGLREHNYTTYINEVVKSIPIFDRSWDRERIEHNRQLETEYYRNLHAQLEARRHEQF